MQTLFRCQFTGVGERLVKVGAPHNQRCAKCLHGTVLVRAVSLRHHNHCIEPMLCSSVSNALAMITARGGTHPLNALLAVCNALGEARHVNHPPSNLERAGWQMVFVLNPDFTTSAGVQQRPGDLRGWVQLFMDQLGSLFQCV